MARPNRDKVTELLAEAASHVVAAQDLQPWPYGWCLPEYRRSGSAALNGPEGPVTLAAEGVTPFEEAVAQLSREPPVRERWDLEEVWGVVASFVVQASFAADKRSLISAAVSRLRSVPMTLVVVPLANVAAPEVPIVLADCVIGAFDEAFYDALASAAAERPIPSSNQREQLGVTYEALSAPVVVAASWFPAQSMLAVEQAEARVRAIFDVALLLEAAPDDLELYSLRGSTNRPGIRGVTLDRSILEETLRSTAAAHELGATLTIIGAHGISEHLRWHSADPFPFEALVKDAERRALLERIVRSGTPVARRIQVAARWYAQAHWSSGKPDAMLALGIALDALVGARSGLPGRAMRERFAFLEPEPSLRHGRAKRYMEIFSVRSAIAHGGASSSVEAPDFVRGAARDVVWATHRLLDFEDRYSPQSDEQLDEGFESLRWGTETW